MLPPPSVFRVQYTHLSVRTYAHFISVLNMLMLMLKCNSHHTSHWSLSCVSDQMSDKSQVTVVHSKLIRIRRPKQRPPVLYPRERHLDDLKVVLDY